MIGTALHSQPVYAITLMRRSNVAGASRRAPAQRRCPSVLGGLGSVFSNARHMLSALVIFAFVIGATICGPAEHQWFDGDDVSVSQTISAEKTSVAQGSVEAFKAPVNQDAPAKGKVPGLCTGHCASHFASLPAQFAQAAVPFEIRTAWTVFEGQQMQASSPSRLERPPRV